MPEWIKTSDEPRMPDDILYANPLLWGISSSPKDHLTEGLLPHAVVPLAFQSSDLRLKTADRPALEQLHRCYFCALLILLALWLAVSLKP